MFNRQLWEAKLWTNKIPRESIQGNAGLETVTKKLLILSMHVIDLFMNDSSMRLTFLFHLNPVPPQMTASSAHVSKSNQQPMHGTKNTPNIFFFFYNVKMQKKWSAPTFHHDFVWKSKTLRAAVHMQVRRYHLKVHVNLCLLKTKNRAQDSLEKLLNF